MLKFFSHICKTLIEHTPAGRAGNKVRDYIFHALSEILLELIEFACPVKDRIWVTKYSQGNPACL